MPVKVLHIARAQRLGVQHEIVGYIGNALFQPGEGLGENLSQGDQHLLTLGVRLIAGGMIFRQHPHLEWCAGSKR